ncbi:proline racemase family protein [Dongia sp.]|uniref:proline racemase family protein n=1 Tax=Dongia sp. TaxID=1977262 RepID=UPI0035B0C391
MRAATTESDDSGTLRPDAGTRIETVEMHTGGEPVRIVTKGYPPIPGRTILEKRRHARAHLDAYRRLIMFEPRGHFDMYGVLPVEPDIAGADMAVLFIHNEGYSTMCGHATIALGRYALDQGLIKAGSDGTARLNLQCPCGLVEVSVAADGAARFRSVPAFAFALDREIDLPGKGRVKLDIGYGGAFYAFLSASTFGLDVRRSRTKDLVAAASAVTEAVKAQVQLHHPDDPDLAFLYGTILTDGGDGNTSPTANICVFAAEEVDRSPTGSGVTARLALMAARGQAAPGEWRRFESVTGSLFEGRVAETLTTGEFPAIRAEVAGRAFYTGSSVFTVEPGDPLGGGFLLK